MGDGSCWVRPWQTSSSYRGHLKFSAPRGDICLLKNLQEVLFCLRKTVSVCSGNCLGRLG